METEGETRKQRLIVIDGGKQRERVKGNEVSGGTHRGRRDDGSTLMDGGGGGGGCVCVCVFLVSACKEPRDKQRERRQDGGATVTKWKMRASATASSILFTFHNHLVSSQQLLCNLKVPHCAKYPLIQFCNTQVHLLRQQTPQK